MHALYKYKYVYKTSVFIVRSVLMFQLDNCLVYYVQKVVS